MKIHTIKHRLFSLFGSTCLYCQLPTQSNSPLCSFCQRNLPYLSHTCYRCTLSLPNNPATKIYCGNCLQTPPYFDRTIACFYYTKPIDFFIHEFKFNQQFIYQPFLSDELLNVIQNNYTTDQLPDCLITVPLHPKRLKTRGFNQTVEIAKPISKQLSIPLLTKHIKRRYHRKNQHDLPAHLRKRNLSNIFYCQKPIRYDHIAIIDDVMTTGSTVNAIAKLLKKQGVKSIDVWCIARTQKKY